MMLAVPSENPKVWRIPIGIYCPGAHQVTGYSIFSAMLLESGVRIVFQVPPSTKFSHDMSPIAGSALITGGAMKSAQALPNKAGISTAKSTARSGKGSFEVGGSGSVCAVAVAVV